MACILHTIISHHTLCELKSQLTTLHISLSKITLFNLTHCLLTLLLSLHHLLSTIYLPYKQSQPRKIDIIIIIIIIIIIDH